MSKKFFFTFCLGIFLYSLFDANLDRDSDYRRSHAVPAYTDRELKASQGLAHFSKQNKVNVQNKIELPPNFQYPNGITRARDGTLYVGSVVSGQILQISPDDKITTFFPGSQEVFAATSFGELLLIFWVCLMLMGK